jgi:hypothetical protein
VVSKLFHASLPLVEIRGIRILSGQLKKMEAIVSGTLWGLNPFSQVLGRAPPILPKTERIGPIV